MTDTGATLDRLSVHFGEDPVRSLVQGFATTLDEALVALEAGEGHPIAHRIAGVAGTLGFSDVGRQWLALADGDGNASDAIRDVSADALRFIADRYGNTRTT